MLLHNPNNLQPAVRAKIPAKLYEMRQQCPCYSHWLQGRAGGNEKTRQIQTAGLLSQLSSLSMAVSMYSSVSESLSSPTA